jgi:Divergent CRAL/TRIO domain
MSHPRDSVDNIDTPAHLAAVAEYLASARAADLSDLEARDVVRVWDGLDTSGRQVVVVTPANLPPDGAARERALMLFARDVHAVAEKPYRVLYVHSGRAVGLNMGIWFSRRARAVLPSQFRKHAVVFSVVHPDLFCRFVMYALRPFVSAAVCICLTEREVFREMHNASDDQLTIAAFPLHMLPISWLPVLGQIAVV